VTLVLIAAAYFAIVAPAAAKALRLDPSAVLRSE
jgi:hypothetical protein